MRAGEEQERRTPARAGRSGRALPDPSRVQDLFLARLEELEKRVAAELSRPVHVSGALQEFALDLARESWRIGMWGVRRLAQPQRIVQAVALGLAASPTDELGVDRRLAARVRAVLVPFSRAWLRVDGRREARLPEGGGVLVTFNRSAWPLPTEALVLWAIVSRAATLGRQVYVLWEPDLLERPFVGDFLQRIGVMAATSDNARLLLERGAIVIAFPEGSAARAKTYERRYRLERFDDAFVVSAAVAAGARIVPGAVVGNEESYPVLAAPGGVPLTPTFPIAGLAGLLPLPLRWRIRLGSPVQYADRIDGDGPDRSGPVPGGEGLEDAVRARMQSMLGEMLAERRSILNG